MQCETMKPAPFAMGGCCDKATHRCRNDATHQVVGKTKKEKKQPPMMICSDCLEVFLDRNPDYKDCVSPVAATAQK